MMGRRHSTATFTAENPESAEVMLVGSQVIHVPLCVLAVSLCALCGERSQARGSTTLSGPPQSWQAGVRIEHWVSAAWPGGRQQMCDRVGVILQQRPLPRQDQERRSFRDDQAAQVERLLGP